MNENTTMFSYTTEAGFDQINDPDFLPPDLRTLLRQADNSTLEAAASGCGYESASSGGSVSYTFTGCLYTVLNSNDLSRAQDVIGEFDNSTTASEFHF